MPLTACPYLIMYLKIVLLPYPCVNFKKLVPCYCQPVYALFNFASLQNLILLLKTATLPFLEGICWMQLRKPPLSL